MKMKNILFLLITLLTVNLFAQVDRSIMPKPGPAPEIKIGETESFTLENGLKVFVVENHKLPRITFSLVLDLDPILEGENMGYISTAGALLGTATTTKTKVEIDEAIDFIGGSLNASASGVNASSLKKHMGSLVELMADVALNPVFKQEELDKIIKQSLSGLEAAKEDPSAIAGNVRSAIVYGKDHPYGEMETEETVKSITLDMCKGYYETYFKPNIAYMAIVGDIDLDEAEEIVEEYFSDWEKKDVPTETYKKVKAPLVRKVNIVDRPASVQSVINVTYPIDLKKGAEDVVAVSVMNQILGGGMSGRLFLNLREDKAYTYGAYSSISSDMLVGRFGASCEARNEVTDSAITEFLSEMKKIRSQPVTQEELDAAKNYLAGSFSRSLESPSTVARFALSIERYNLPKDYYKTYLQRLSAVTIDDVKKVAKKYIRPNNAYILVVGNANDVAEDLKKFSVNGKVTYLDIYGEEYDPSAIALPEGLTAETVINEYIESIGGKEAMANVTDRVNVLKGQIQGMDLSLTITQKSPNKFKMELSAGPMQQVTKFDGVKGVTVAMGQTQPMEDKQIEEMKIEAMMFPELQYAELGVKAELIGAEELDGKEVYVVLVTLPSGKKKTQYFDTESKLILKEATTLETAQGNFPQVTEFADYKAVDGILYPHTITQQMGPQTIPMKVESISVNKGIEDSVFTVE